MKHLGKIALAGVGLFALYSFRSTKKLVSAIGDVKVKIDKIHSVRLANMVHLKVDLRLLNPTKQDIGVSTFGLVKIKELRFYKKRDNSYIGSAFTNIDNIKIPAQKVLAIKDIKAEIPYQSAISNIGLFTGSTNEKLKIVLIFETFGKTLKLTTDG